MKVKHVLDNESQDPIPMGTYHVTLSGIETDYDTYATFTYHLQAEQQGPQVAETETTGEG